MLQKKHGSWLKAIGLPVILAYSMKRSVKFWKNLILRDFTVSQYTTVDYELTTSTVYTHDLQLKNFSQKYLKSIFFNIGGVITPRPLPKTTIKPEKNSLGVI